MPSIARYGCCVAAKCSEFSSNMQNRELKSPVLK